MVNFRNMARSVHQLIVIVPILHLLLCDFDFSSTHIQSNFVDAWALPLRSLSPFQIGKANQLSMPDFSLPQVMNRYIFMPSRLPSIPCLSLLPFGGNNFSRITINPVISSDRRFYTPLPSFSYAPFQK